jgi:hypothetical protein
MSAMRPLQKTLPPRTPQAALRAALGVLSAAAVLGFSAPAFAGDDDVPLDTQLLRGLMHGLGLQRGDEPEINYQERAPLVIPPDRDLPPPQRADAATAGNPAWPKDPDIARAKAEAKLERERNVQAEVDMEQNRLSPQQMAPGAKPGVHTRSARRTDNPSVSSNGTDRLSPNELGASMSSLFGNMFSSGDEKTTAKFTGEPTRSALTDPPVGYRTPSPDQPYGFGKEKAASQATDYYGTKGEINSDGR